MNVLARQTRGSGGNRNWQKCVSRRQSTKIFSGEPQILQNVNKGGFLFMPLPPQILRNVNKGGFLFMPLPPQILRNVNKGGFLFMPLPPQILRNVNKGGFLFMPLPPQILRNVNKSGFLFMPLPRSPTWSLAYLVTSFNMCMAPTFMQILSPSPGAYH